MEKDIATLQKELEEATAAIVRATQERDSLDPNSLLHESKDEEVKAARKRAADAKGALESSEDWKAEERIKELREEMSKYAEQEKEAKNKRDKLLLKPSGNCDAGLMKCNNKIFDCRRSLDTKSKEFMDIKRKQFQRDAHQSAMFNEFERLEGSIGKRKPPAPTHRPL